MASRSIFLQDGSVKDPKTRFRTRGAVRLAGAIVAYPGELIGSITQRAYGANTPELRQRIIAANANLKGNINVPR